MKLNHIGIVVSNIKERLKFYEKICGPFSFMPSVIPDEAQQVKVCFIEVGEVTLELIEPLNKASPVSKFLRKGGGINHLCFEVENTIDEIPRLAKEIGGLIVKEPAPAAAFAGKRIAFVFFKELGLVEFLEVGDQNG